MREWLANNYTWLFSGAAVSAIVAVLGFFKWKRKSNGGGNASTVSQVGRDSIASPVAGRDVHQTINNIILPPKESENSSEFNETPKPNDLEAHVENVPLLQRNAVCSGFVGLKVKWPAVIRTLFHHGENEVEAALKYGDKRYRGGLDIVANLDLRQYTKLRSVVGGELVTVWGTIVRMNAVEIELRVDRLVFDREPLEPEQQEQ
jgi:hypothetical protein